MSKVNRVNQKAEYKTTLYDRLKMYFKQNVLDTEHNKHKDSSKLTPYAQMKLWARDNLDLRGVSIGPGKEMLSKSGDKVKLHGLVQAIRKWEGSKK